MNVSQGDLADLFSFFAKMKGEIYEYKNSNTTLEAQDRCLAMMSRDYMVSLIPNTFCRTYPADIILLGNLNPEGEEPIKAGELLAHEEFGSKLKEMMEASKHCRCHQRIPVPVLVVRNKILARSAGLSDALENIYETGSMSSFNDPVAFRKKMIDLDTKWLRTLLISDICDLMTEVKSGFLGLTLVASEKGFKEYYDEGFALSALPYPGVQYFKGFVQASGTGAYPRPPWKKFKLEPRFGRPMRLPSPYRWQEYKAWSQLELTQNIVRYLFSVLRDPKCSGMLVHCISGWDRTPHFVSLLRVLLWAEGEAHQSLNVDQMLYLTMAYDWFLFGHQLSHRLKKQQEIMFYTFDVLGHLLAPDFSLYLGDFAHLAHERPNGTPRAEAPMPSSSAPTTPSSSRVETASTSSAESTAQPQSPASEPSPVPTDAVAEPCLNNLEETLSDAKVDEIVTEAPKEETVALTDELSDLSDVNPFSTKLEELHIEAPAKKQEDLLSTPAPATLPAAASSSSTASTPATTPRSAAPSVAEMLNQSIVGLTMEDKIDARKHRLFEIRDRFFYFYKTHVYPTYRK